MTDGPLSSEELRRLTAEDATKEVPDELRGFDPPPLPEREFRRIERTDLRREGEGGRSGTIEAHRPPWVPLTFSPRRVRAPKPPVIKHHGERLEPLFIWQPDDRRTYNDTTYPWGCVCKITTAAGAQGSGVLIGPRHVLTASHCIDWNTSAAEKIEVHRNGANAAATAWDTLVYAFTQIQGPDVGYTDMDEDYAVLVLDQRLGDRFGWMGTKVYDSDWDDENVWRTIGYPGDIGGGVVPTYQRDKSLDEDEFDYGSGRAMTTSADTMKGQSGSPMFAFWAEDHMPYAVAVVSSEGSVVASGDENWCAGGSDLSRIVRQARDENP